MELVDGLLAMLDPGPQPPSAENGGLNGASDLCNTSSQQVF